MQPRGFMFLPLGSDLLRLMRSHLPKNGIFLDDLMFDEVQWAADVAAEAVQTEPMAHD